jgi:hypothetical protein
MKPISLLVLVAGFSACQGVRAETSAQVPAFRPIPLSQTEAMLPAPKVTAYDSASAAGAKANANANALPHEYRAPENFDEKANRKPVISSRRKLARFRAKPASEVGEDRSDPYEYKGWDATSLYEPKASTPGWSTQ